MPGILPDMPESTLRLEALKLALNGREGHAASDVVKAAGEFFSFLKGEKTDG